MFIDGVDAGQQYAGFKFERLQVLLNQGGIIEHQCRTAAVTQHVGKHVQAIYRTLLVTVPAVYDHDRAGDDERDHAGDHGDRDELVFDRCEFEQAHRYSPMSRPISISMGNMMSDRVVRQHCIAGCRAEVLKMSGFPFPVLVSATCLLKGQADVGLIFQFHG